MSVIHFIFIFFTIAATGPLALAADLDGIKTSHCSCDFSTKPLHRNKVQNNMLQ